MFNYPYLPIPSVPPVAINSTFPWWKGPPTLRGLSISLYEDSPYDTDLLCGMSTEYGVCQKWQATKSGKGGGSSDGNAALSSRQSADEKGKKKRDLTDIMCYAVGRRDTYGVAVRRKGTEW